MKTIRILAVIFFLVFLILTAIGVYLIIKDSISLYSIADFDMCHGDKSYFLS